MNKRVASWFQGVLSVILMLALVLPSVAVPHIAWANLGGGETGAGGFESDVGEGPDGQSSAEAADAAAEAAGQAANDAAAAGLSANAPEGVSVSGSDATPDSDPNNPTVDVDFGNGQTVSGVSPQAAEAMMDAVAAGLAPATNGQTPGFNPSATAEAHATGKAGIDGVVGNVSATLGSVASVAAAESKAAIGLAAAQAAADATAKSMNPFGAAPAVNSLSFTTLSADEALSAASKHPAMFSPQPLSTSLPAGFTFSPPTPTSKTLSSTPIGGKTTAQTFSLDNATIDATSFSLGKQLGVPSMPGFDAPVGGSYSPTKSDDTSKNQYAQYALGMEIGRYATQKSLAESKYNSLVDNATFNPATQNAQMAMLDATKAEIDAWSATIDSKLNPTTQNQAVANISQTKAADLGKMADQIAATTDSSKAAQLSKSMAEAIDAYDSQISDAKSSAQAAQNALDAANKAAQLSVYGIVDVTPTNNFSVPDESLVDQAWGKVFGVAPTQLSPVATPVISFLNAVPFVGIAQNAVLSITPTPVVNAVVDAIPGTKSVEAYMDDEPMSVVIGLAFVDAVTLGMGKAVSVGIAGSVAGKVSISAPSNTIGKAATAPTAASTAGKTAAGTTGKTVSVSYNPTNNTVTVHAPVTTSAVVEGKIASGAAKSADNVATPSSLAGKAADDVAAPTSPTSGKAPTAANDNVPANTPANANSLGSKSATTPAAQTAKSADNVATPSSLAGKAADDVATPSSATAGKTSPASTGNNPANPNAAGYQTAATPAATAAKSADNVAAPSSLAGKAADDVATPSSATAGKTPTAANANTPANPNALGSKSATTPTQSVSPASKSLSVAMAVVEALNAPVSISPAAISKSLSGIVDDIALAISRTADDINISTPVSVAVKSADDVVAPTAAKTADNAAAPATVSGTGAKSTPVSVTAPVSVPVSVTPTTVQTPAQPTVAPQTTAPAQTAVKATADNISVPFSPLSPLSQAQVQSIAKSITDTTQPTVLGTIAVDMPESLGRTSTLGSPQTATLSSNPTTGLVDVTLDNQPKAQVNSITPAQAQNALASAKATPMPDDFLTQTLAALTDFFAPPTEVIGTFTLSIPDKTATPVGVAVTTVSPTEAVAAPSVAAPSSLAGKAADDVATPSSATAGKTSPASTGNNPANPNAAGYQTAATPANQTAPATTQTSPTQTATTPTSNQTAPTNAPNSPTQAAQTAQPTFAQTPDVTNAVPTSRPDVTTSAAQPTNTQTAPAPTANQTAPAAAPTAQAPASTLGPVGDALSTIGKGLTGAFNELLGVKPAASQPAKTVNFANLERTPETQDFVGAVADDARFLSFEDNTTAARALLRDLENKIKGLEASKTPATLNNIIPKYSPASDNNNPAQHANNIAGVAAKDVPGFTADTPITLADLKGPVGVGLVKGFAKAEEGIDLPTTEAVKGVEAYTALPSIPTTLVDGVYAPTNPADQVTLNNIRNGSPATVAPATQTPAQTLLAVADKLSKSTPASLALEIQAAGLSRIADALPQTKAPAAEPAVATPSAPTATNPSAQTQAPESISVRGVNPVKGGMLYGNSPEVGPRTRVNSLGVGRPSQHRGTDIYPADFKADRGVVSRYPGTVVNIRHGSQGYGTYVEIKNENGTYSRYAHITPEAGLKTGDTVTAGQPIGKISGTGTAFGAAVAGIAAKQGLDPDAAYNAAIDQFLKNGWGNTTPPHLHYEERSTFNAFYGKSLIDSTKTLGYTRGVSYAQGAPAGATQPAPVTAVPAQTAPEVTTAVPTSRPDTVPASVAPSAPISPIPAQVVAPNVPTLSTAPSSPAVNNNVSGLPSTPGQSDTTVSPTTNAGVPPDFQSTGGTGPVAGGNTGLVNSVLSPVYAFFAAIAVGINALLGADEDDGTEEEANTAVPNTSSITFNPNGVDGGVPGSTADSNEPDGGPVAGVGTGRGIVTNSEETPSNTSINPRSELTPTQNIVATSTKDTTHVLIQVDGNTGDLYFDIAGVYASGEYYEDYFWDDEDPEDYDPKLSQPRIVLDDQRLNILYSDGTYAPVVIDGVWYESADDPNYVYTVEYYLDGELVAAADNAGVLPEGNPLTNLLGNLFSSSDEYGLEDVDTITRALVDPDEQVPADEYYIYRVYLNGGGTRSTSVPRYTSYRFMSERFAETGFTGNVTALIAESVEVPPPSRGGVSAIVDTFKKIGLSVIDIFRDDEAENPVVTDFGNLTPSDDGEITMADIRNVTVLLDVEAECPLAPGLDRPYLYEIVIAQAAISGATTDQAFRAVRCGGGDKADFVEQIAAHFETFDGVGTIDRQAMSDMIRFALFKDLDLSFLLKNDEPGEPTATSTPATVPDGEDQEYVPNLTNDVMFEVKAVGSQGQTLLDWSVANEIRVGSTVQLYFRWDGSDYEQCLPFLNDNGVYALKASGGKMTTGNTESEGYDVPEANTTYRIECGGQRNNEFGVDDRSIKVIIE